MRCTHEETFVAEEYADDPEWEYGFRMEPEGPVGARMFGMPFTSFAMAEHSGRKYDATEYVRHPKGSTRDDDWEPLPEPSDPGMTASTDPALDPHRETLAFLRENASDLGLTSTSQVLEEVESTAKPEASDSRSQVLEEVESTAKPEPSDSEVTSSPPMTVEQACEFLHDAYEEAAVGAGWKTQEASRTSWADLPIANKATMRVAVAALMRELAESQDSGSAS